ncbi:hypothetical protein RB195_011047 [Necator americanus]|uniref:Uncharacterized protein n=1 Tax=Necator americanus TaxID=51031 RepID=A0ABR1D1X8_NECAM
MIRRRGESVDRTNDSTDEILSFSLPDSSRQNQSFRLPSINQSAMRQELYELQRSAPLRRSHSWDEHSIRSFTHSENFISSMNIADNYRHEDYCSTCYPYSPNEMDHYFDFCEVNEFYRKVHEPIIQATLFRGQELLATVFTEIRLFALRYALATSEPLSVAPSSPYRVQSKIRVIACSMKEWDSPQQITKPNVHLQNRFMPFSDEIAQGDRMDVEQCSSFERLVKLDGIGKKPTQNEIENGRIVAGVVLVGIAAVILCSMWFLIRLLPLILIPAVCFYRKNFIYDNIRVNDQNALAGACNEQKGDATTRDRVTELENQNERLMIELEKQRETTKMLLKQIEDFTSISYGTESRVEKDFPREYIYRQ